MSWDTERLYTTLLNWPRGTTINWSKVAGEHGIFGGNAGQIVKEFALERGIDITHMTTSTPTRKPTKRPCKKKLPGFDISIPSNPPLKKFESEIQTMIESGRFTQGEECASYTVTTYIVENGKLTPHNKTVYARKVPLTDLRQRLLNKHQKYIRLTPSPAITAMTEDEIRGTLKAAHIQNI